MKLAEQLAIGREQNQISRKHSSGYHKFLQIYNMKMYCCTVGVRMRLMVEYLPLQELS